MTDSRIFELDYAIQKIKWDIIGLCETRRKIEEIEEYSDYILYHTKSSQGQNGVGFIVKKHLKKNINSFKSYSDRVATLEINLSSNNVLTFIQAYAPTEKCKDDELDLFYSTLETAIESAYTNKYIIMGDFNAQIGKSLQGEERAFGMYSNGKRSKHGQRLVEFAIEKNLKFTNSMYKIRPSRKWTWQSPNGLYRNEIDYILTGNDLKVQNFNIIQNLNFYTDHRMIRCTLHVEMIRKRKFINPTRNYTRDLPILSRESGKQWEDNFKQAVERSYDIQNQYNNFEKEMTNLFNQIPNTRKDMYDDRKSHIKKLLQERKKLYQERRTREIRNKITQISKQINREISDNTKEHRRLTFEKYINTTGAVKKAYVELQRSSKWTPNITDKAGNNKIKRLDIIKEATKFNQRPNSMNAY